MDLINKIPQVPPSSPIPDCVASLIELLNLTRNEDVRKEIGEQAGIQKLHDFAKGFFTHPHTRDYFTQEPDAKNPVIPKTATNILRVFRNLCVHSKDNQNRIRETGVCEYVVSFLAAASVDPSNDVKVAIRSGVQFFGNFVTSNEANATYFWGIGFPKLLTQMLNMKDDSCCEHTLMLLYNCVKQVPKLRAEMVNNAFYKVFIDTLVGLQDSLEPIHTQSFQWIYITLMSVFSADMFEQAYETLRDPEDTLKEQERQLAMLKTLDAMVEKVAEDLPRRSGRGDEEGDLPKLDEQYVITPACCSFFVRELARMYNKDFSRVSKAAHAANEAAKNESSKTDSSKTDSAKNDSEKTETPSTAPGVQVAQSLATVLSANEYELIYFMLRVLGHITSLVEECESTRMCKNGNDLRTNLGKEGLIALIIGTLRGVWELEQAAKARKDKSAQFAPGYKRELMGLIANLTYNNKGNQDEVRELGGVELVLNHCNIDDNNPFIREWALFAVRNLLEDNPENQAIVKGLKAERVSDTHGVMQELGIGAELVNGVLKFKQNAPPPKKDTSKPDDNNNNSL